MVRDLDLSKEAAKILASRLNEKHVLHSSAKALFYRKRLSRIFELREEVKLLLVAKQKHDLLLAFGGDGFSTYLAYLADIFEALNQLNKKLQGLGTNIIVRSDVINAFVVKLNLWRKRAKNNNFASFELFLPYFKEEK